MELVERFLKAGLYLRGWQPRTVRTYRQALEQIPEVPTKDALSDWAIAMRERGVTPGGCNVYIRSVNSYLSWLKEEGHLAAPLRVKLLAAPPKALACFTESEIRRLRAFRPRKRTDHRTLTLIHLLLDTGIHIDEAPTLKQLDCDFANCLIKVRGKGGRERIIPMSIEGRKSVYRYATKHPGRLLFSSRNGTPLMYRNVRREISQLMREASPSAPVIPSRAPLVHALVPSIRAPKGPERRPIPSPYPCE